MSVQMPMLEQSIDLRHGFLSGGKESDSENSENICLHENKLFTSDKHKRDSLDTEKRSSVGFCLTFMSIQNLPAIHFNHSVANRRKNNNNSKFNKLHGNVRDADLNPENKTFNLCGLCKMLKDCY